MAAPLIPFKRPSTAGPWSGGYQGYQGNLAPSTPAQANAESAVGTGPVASVTTTSSPTTATTRPIISKDEMAAAKAVEKSQNDIKTATVQKMDAENALDQKALEAEQRRIDQENAAAERAVQMEAHIISENEKAQAAADAAQRDADARVKTSQDQAINWDDRGAGTRILQALIRGASAKNSLIMGRDPGQSHVIKALDENLAAEKEKKFRRYQADEENAKILKSRNKEEIDRLNANLRAKATLEANANARNLLMSEKTDALAAKLAAKDPSGQAYQANKALALATLDQSDAMANRQYAATARSSQTTQSGQSQTVTTSGAEADKRPVATREEANDYAVAKDDVEKLDALIAQAEKSPEDVKHALEARTRFEEGQKELKAAEDISVWPGIPVGKMVNTVTKIGGRWTAPKGTPGEAQSALNAAELIDKDKHPGALDAFTGIEDALGMKARSFGGVVNQGDREAAEAAAALSTRGPGEYVKYLKQLKKIRSEQAAALAKLGQHKKGLE